MRLHFRKLGQGQPLLILHGLFGSSDNWQTLGKRFAKHHTVYLIDQRNHGHSAHSNEFNYSLMAQDLFELVKSEALDDFILLGHSMGGKTVMQFTIDYPNLARKIIIADIGFKKYPPHHDLILEGLNSVDLSIQNSRKKVDEHLTKKIPDFITRQFLLKNLYWREKGILDWRINIPVLTREIGSIVDEISMDKESSKTLFLRGAKSNYILDEDVESIKSVFINSEVKTIENAGHWLHAEQPDVFFDLVMQFTL